MRKPSSQRLLQLAGDCIDDAIAFGPQDLQDLREALVELIAARRDQRNGEADAGGVPASIAPIAVIDLADPMTNLAPDKVQALQKSASLELPLLAWLAIHGNVCLGLRHPMNRGPSRAVTLEALKGIGSVLVDHGVLLREQLEAAERLEREQQASTL
ncbi:MAG TPA: hypothetical protein VGF89_01120 [Steroidobacteraceae bacterium]